MAAGIWAPFKELATTVHTAIAMKQSQAYYRLESTLKKHKTDFYSLLKNPPRNTSHRSQVENSIKEGLVVSSISQSLLLPQDFIDEALILSDILDLNELTAVELLLAGEQHQPDFPTLSRGLVAVLLYYDGRRNLVTSLRSLIQAREGVSWTLGLSSNVVALVTNFTDGLFQNNLVENILQLLKEINVEKELEKLAEGKAIKDAQHKQQIVDLIDETKYALADCLFYWACQNPFPQAAILKVLKELKQLPATNEDHQRLNYIYLSLFFTLLVSFQAGDSTQDATTLDSSLIDEHYPLIADTNSVPAIHKAITKKEKTDKDNWSNPALEAAVKFAWAVFLRECSSLEAFKEECDVLEKDEQQVDEAVEAGAFQFMRQAVVNSSFFFQEEYYVRCLHQLLTKFIHLMPVKITELRNRGDEVAREEMMRMVRGAPPTPKLQQNFGELMKLVGDVYSKDPNNLNLSLEYWPSIEMDSQFSQSSQALQHRQLSLYKFIHQCSDLLPPSLFHPFMHMLVGLSSSPQTAHQCFNFLKSNSPSLGGGGPSAVISFDHFFHSLRQYYLGLRQGAGPKHTPTGCAISPQELDGLLVVLKLITVIVDQDKDARVVIYDNQTWLPVASLFGLIGCPISRQLKTQIFLTLAAFAKTPDIAATMWNILEVSQVLNTSPVSGNISGTQFGLAPIQQEGSLQIELEEFESAAEEYSETRAFLSLLDSLTDIPVSGYLGADHRVPGFQPYLEFIRDVVFLKFDSRGYKDPQEKWMVASGALKILHKLLANHEISSDDLIEQQHEISQGRFVSLPKQPGFTILLHLFNDSALLRKLLCIVDECCRLLSDVESCTDKVANTALLALKTLETALSKQDEFLTILRSNTAHSVMATPLDDLLLGINPRSRKADHYVNIARYITFSSCSPELALTAVRILYLASHSPSVAREIINSLTSDRDVCSSVLHGFVEHLEWEESYFEPHPPDSEQDMEGGGGGEGEIDQVRRQLKEDIVNLLILCVSKPTLNIAHLLLGFLEIQDTPRGRLKKISETILQDPGVLGSPKNCLHAILSLIQIGADPSNPIGCHYTHPKLAELCYHLIYLLCDNRELSQSTLRYLRNNHDYFYSQLLHIPFPWLLESQEVDDTTKMYYSQQGWILRSVAIELRMTFLNNQRSHTQRLVTLLLKSSTTLTHQLNEFDYSMTSQVTTWTDMDHSTDPSLMEDGRRKILVLLDLLSLSGIELPPLQLQYFDQSRTEEVIKSCETKDVLGREGAVTYVNVKLLHRLLMNELNGLQGAVAVSQKPYIIKEIHNILGVVVERNRIQEILHCRQFLMESWQQLVEILVGVVNEEGRERLRITVLFELIQDLLLKIEEYNDANSLTAAAQSVVFTLMSHLRQSLQTLSNQSDQIDQTLAPISTGPLQSILRGLLDNLLRCPSGMQRLRAYLYATLLCYLHMTQDREAKVQTFRGGLWRLEHDATGLASANLNILSGCGEGLMDTVCRDACSGHDIAKMLALSILDSILCLDKHSTWLKYMVSRGYLQTICASLQQDDEGLQNLLKPLPLALRPIYVYESKMAFLIRVASTSLGARELVTKNCVALLSECRFIDSRPMYHGNVTSIPSNTAGFIPSVSSRYLQLFLPVLRFLITLLTTSGSQQIEASSQVVDFIATHSNVFVSVLKESNTCVSMATLQELSLVAAVISQCRAGHDWSLDVSNPHTARLLRLQDLVMSLLPYYCLPSHWKQVAQEVVKNEEGYESGGSGRSSMGGALWEEAFSLSQRVCVSLVSYCQNAMSIGGTEFSAQYSRIIFTPELSQPINATGLSGDQSFSSPSLALLVTALKEICDSYYSVLETSQQLKKKMENLKELTSEEMKQLLSDISQDDKTQMTPSQLQQLVRAALQRLLASKQQQLTNFLYIVEHLLYILWRHLQFYLVHCRPMKLSNEYGVKGMTHPHDPTMRRLQDTGNRSVMTGQHDSKSSGFDLSNLSTGITENDLEQLRLNAVKILTDTMFKKLLDLSESHPSTKETMTIGFINALVRRMRKLIKLKAAAKPVLQL